MGEAITGPGKSSVHYAHMRAVDRGSRCVSHAILSHALFETPVLPNITELV